MPEPALEADVCRRCGHRRHDPSSSLSRFVRRAVGRKPRRVECGEPTDLGWACPCRSRFHGG